MSNPSNKTRLQSQIAASMAEVGDLYVKRVKLVLSARAVDIVMEVPSRANIAHLNNTDTMSETGMSAALEILEAEIKQVAADINGLETVVKDKQLELRTSMIREDAGEIAKIKPEDRQAWIEKQITAFREGDEKEKQKVMYGLQKEMGMTAAAVKKVAETFSGNEEEEKKKTETLDGLAEDILKAGIASQKTAKKVSGEECDTCGAASQPDGGKLLNCGKCWGAKYCSRECQLIDRQSGHKEVCKKA